MEKEEKSKAKNVETYTDDMVKILKSDKGATIKKIIHEEEERESRKEKLSPESLKNKTFMLVGTILVLVALFGAVFSFLLKEKIIVVPVKPQFTPIIFADENVFLETEDLEKEEIADLLSREVQSADVKVDGIEGIHLTENEDVIGFEEFSQRIESRFPKEAIPFVNEDFLFGSYHSKTDTKNLFILLKVRSFADIFRPFQSWEAKMFSDLYSFFDIRLTAENSYLQTKDFEDGIIDNKNARILYDKEGDIVLFYVFADDKSVVISNSQPAAAEAMLRLAGSKVKK